MKSFSEWTRQLAEQINRPAEPEIHPDVLDAIGADGVLHVDCCICGRRCEADPEWFPDGDMSRHYGGCGPSCIP